MRSFSAWKRRNFYWRETTPLLGSGGFLPPKRRKAKPCLPSFLRKLAVFIQDVFIFQKHFCGFPDVFFAFKRTFAACSVQFQRSKELSLSPWCGFGLQKCFRAFPGAVSCFKSIPTACPGAISAFKSIPKTFPVRFWLLGAFPCVSRRVFGFWEHSQDFPGTFSLFGSVPTAFPTHFQRLGVVFGIKFSKKHT